MKKRFLCIVLLLLILIPSVVLADLGPKPSINIKAITCAVQNNSGATLVAGSGVYPTGVSDGIVTVAKCDNTDMAKMPCLGIISADIADGAAGKAVCRGIKGMNTSGFTGSAGERIYIKSDGTLDTVAPTSGSVQRIGILISKAADGKIYVHSRGRKSTYASAAGEHPIVRMGNDTGHKKVAFHKYDNSEVAYVDENAVMKITSLTDGSDAATVANMKDAIDKKHTQPMSAAGDIIVGGTSGVAARLGKGSDTEVLTLASGTPSWAAPAGGGISDLTDKYRRWYLQDSIDGYTKTVDGTCDVVHKGQSVEFTTDATNGNKAYLVTNSILQVNSSQTITVEWIFTYCNDENWEAHFMFMVGTTPFTAITGTNAHFGFVMAGNRHVWATNGHASNYTQTDLGILQPKGSETAVRFKVVCEQGTDCKFYSGSNGTDDILKATHTTNKPIAANYSLHLGIRNTSAAARTVRFDRVFVEHTCH